MAFSFMKNLILTSIIFAFFSCSSGDNKSQETAEQNKSEVEQERPNKPSTEEIQDEENDCVFNNDHYGLTTEWLKESGLENFKWDNKLSQAMIPQNGDTIILTKGGCTHFEYYVKLTLYDDSATVSNIEHWTELSIKLADQFGFEHFSRMLRTGKFVKVTESGNSFWLEITDDDPNDNLIYNGVEVNLEKSFKYIAISKYVN